MQRALKVLFLVADRRLVSCRFRVLQYLSHLQRRGVATAVLDLNVPRNERRQRIARAAEFDVVVVQRALLGPIEVALLRRAARRWLFDFDDAIMLRDSTAAPRFRSWQRQMRFQRMVRNADHVIAGNAYLAEQARTATDAVTIVPSVVDLADYPHVADFSGPPVIGWIGTRVNLMYLEAIAPALRRVIERCPAARMNVVADGSPDMRGVSAAAKQWSAASEATDLASFHVGVMPLSDDPWTRGKCAIKLLQYMAAGVPVVCSPVGANTEIVEDGVNGHFAGNEDEWVDRIGALLNDPARCRAFGAAGRRTVEERYSVAPQLDRLLAVLNGDRIPDLAPKA